MNICLRGLGSTYEAEHLARVFYPQARIHSKRYAQKGDCVLCVLGKKHLLCAVRVNGEVSFLRQSHSGAQVEGNLDFKLCTLLYKLLVNVSGFKPPWGLLTGVRPVSIVHDMRKKKEDDSKIKEVFLNKYYVNSEKTNLAIKIADIQEPIIRFSTPRSFSLYISIPFCPSRCSYCSFVSRTTAQSKKLMQPYIELLEKEINSIAKLSKQLGLQLETIYIGGGTPTALSEEQLIMLMRAVSNNFDISALREYTVEAGRPDCTTSEKLHIIKEYGATRISINPQTLSDNVLNTIGRSHTAQDIVDCFYAARKQGHNNINMDLIAGLPSDTALGFENSLKGVIALAPENITVHTLTLKRASNIVLNSEQAKYASAADMLKKSKLLAQSKYLPYYLYRQKNTLENLENIGYSKKGYECLYNIYIMEEIHSILSAGAAGSTKLCSTSGKIERIFNYKYPSEYISRFDILQTKKKGVIDFYASYMDT